MIYCKANFPTSSDSDVKAVNTEDITKVISIENQHTSGVKHISYHPSGKLIATSDVEGVLRLFAVSKDAPSPASLLYKKDGIIPKLRGDDPYSSSKLAWHNSGSYFAVPTALNSVAVYSRNFDEIANFEIDRNIIQEIKSRQTKGSAGIPGSDRASAVDDDDDDSEDAGVVSEAVSDIAWSPNGVYLAASTADGLLLIWDVTTRMLLRANRVNFKITGLSWSPKSNEISFTTSKGSLHTFSEAIDLSISKKLPQEKQTDVEFKTATEFEKSEQKENGAKKPASESSAVRPNPYSSRVEKHFRDDETQLIDGQSNGNKKARHREPEYDSENDDDLLGSNANGDEGFIEDDDGTYAKEMAEERIRKRKRKNGEYMDEDDYDNGEDNGRDEMGLISRKALDRKLHDIVLQFSKHLKTSKYQPFQQGSTQWKNDRRYLTINLVGHIWTMQEGTHNTISVEFFDQGTNRKYTIRDPIRYEMACLTKAGCLFARPGAYNERSPSKTSIPRIFYRSHIGGSASNWEYKFIPQIHGTISNIALSETRAQVYTSEGYVFTFTLGGTPVRVSHTNDRVVTSAAWGDYFLTVCEPPGTKESCNLRYSIENTNTFEMLQNNHPLGLSPGAKLLAAFFSESGDPCIYDSTGSLKVLAAWRAMFQAPWVPVFDARVARKEDLEEVASLMESLDEEDDDDDISEFDRLLDEQDNSRSKSSKDTKKQEIAQKIGLIMNKRFAPLGLNDENEFLAFPLTGSELGLPLPSNLEQFDLQVPLITTTPHEQSYLVQSVSHELAKDRGDSGSDDSDDWRLEMNKSLLRQFQGACAERKSDKAIEISRLLSTSKSLAVASKIAVDSNLPSLANFVNELRADLAQKEQDADDSGY